MQSQTLSHTVKMIGYVLSGEESEYHKFAPDGKTVELIIQKTIFTK